MPGIAPVPCSVGTRSRWGGLLSLALAGLLGGRLQAQVTEVPAWELVWSDEFSQPNGSAPDSRSWNYDQGGGGWGNLELQTYTNRRENSRIENGNLVIEARRETFTGTDGISRNYTSARIKTQNKVTWTYGRMEARIQIPETKGIWPAFWMLGSTIQSVGWPSCGEIDIMENIGSEPSRVHGAIHGPGYSAGENIGSYYDLPGGAQFPDGYHLFAVEWEPSVIRWYVDNRRFFTATPGRLQNGEPWVFNNQTFYILLNIAVGGRFPGSPDATTVLPQRMLVDYVRVFRRTTAPPATLNITTGTSGVELTWPLSFPNARLQQALEPGAPWKDVLTPGTRRGSLLVAPGSLGIHRLVWDP